MNKPKPSASTPQLRRETPALPKGTLGNTIKGRWPALYAYLTEDQWEDGSTRQVGTLLLVFDPDGLKACLNDRANGRSLWATGTDLNDVLDSLEEQLGTDSPKWRTHRKM